MPTACSFDGTCREISGRGRQVAPLKKERSLLPSPLLVQMHFFSQVTLATQVPFMLDLLLQNQRDLLKIHNKPAKT